MLPPPAEIHQRCSALPEALPTGRAGPGRAAELFAPPGAVSEGCKRCAQPRDRSSPKWSAPTPSGAPRGGAGGHSLLSAFGLQTESENGASERVGPRNRAQVGRVSASPRGCSYSIASARFPSPLESFQELFNNRCSLTYLQTPSLPPTTHRRKALIIQRDVNSDTRQNS